MFAYILRLTRHDRHGALDILTKDLKVFESYNEEIFKEITNLITLQNFRYEILTLFISFDFNLENYDILT